MYLSTGLSSPNIFTLMQLCCELRAMIWDKAMPDDLTETCIILHQSQCNSGSSSELPKIHDPLVVDTAFPTLMHICHESRQHAMQRIKFRYSPAARTMVPYRHFRPHLDVLYVHGIQNLSWLRNQGLPQLGEVRRLALGCWRPLCGSNGVNRPPSAACVFGTFSKVESISIILPSPGRLPGISRTYPQTPERRFRLEPIYLGGKSNLTCSFREADRSQNGILSFMHKIRYDIASYHTLMWRRWGAEYGNEGGFIDADLNAQYFTTWWYDDKMCKGRFCDSVQFPRGFSSSVETDMRRPGVDPEKIRVNDLRKD